MIQLPREPIAALNRVRLRENGEPLVEIANDLKVLREFAVPFVREGVAKRLNDAAKNLPPKYRIGLREGWRSIERQKFVYDRYFEKLKRENPNASYATLRRMTNRFYAPYDQKAPPGHSTGGAVDVWLLDENGEPIDLHGQGDRFANAPTFRAGLPKEIVEGRRMLFDAMIAAGFTNCRDEWWHYSYGDAAWAVRLNKTECPYGFAPLPENLYRDKDEAFIADVIAREG